MDGPEGAKVLMLIDEKELARRRKAVNMFYFGDFKKSPDDTPDSELNDEEKFVYTTFALTEGVKTGDYKPVTEQEKALYEAFLLFEQSYTPDEWTQIAEYQAAKERAIVEEPIEAATGDERHAILESRRSAYPIPPNVQEIFDRRTRIEHEFLTLLLEYHEKNGTLPDALLKHDFGISDNTQSVAKGLPRNTQSIAKPINDGSILFAANSIHTTTVRSLTRMPWKEVQKPGYSVGIDQKTRDTVVFFGVREGNYTKRFAEYLAKGGVGLIKAHYALWSYWYEQGGSPGAYVTVSVSQLCDRLGFKQHHKGGHRLENKRHAIEMVEGLTRIELEAVYKLPGQGKKGADKSLRLRGPLWQRGYLAEEKDEYTDLFGAAREGDETQWEPKTYSFGPGQWFSDETFRSFAKAVGKVGSGLLLLENNTDQWAIKIGGYLGTIVRAGKYAPRVLFVETILQRANVAQSPNEKRNAGRSQDNFERAFDRLVEVAVIKEWTYTDIAITEPDIDDVDSIAAYGTDESSIYKGNEWRAKKIAIQFPEVYDVDAKRLTEQTAKRISASQQRAANLKKPTNPK